MKRKYPIGLFLYGVITNFFFHFFYLFVPGVILSFVGIWSKSCLGIGLGLLCLDMLLSFVEQFRIRKAALTPSDNARYNELMDALCGPDGLEAFGRVAKKLEDEKNECAAVSKMDREQE